MKYINNHIYIMCGRLATVMLVINDTNVRILLLRTNDGKYK